MESRTHTTTNGNTLTATGYFRGDIGLNDSNLDVEISNETHRLRCKIEPFTKNCGIKAISHVRGDPELLEILESFLFHVCRAGIVVASDYINGGTFKMLKPYFKATDPVWNPVYTWPGGESHKIVLFHKFLGDLKGTNNPWPEWRASNG